MLEENPIPLFDSGQPAVTLLELRRDLPADPVVAKSWTWPLPSRWRPSAPADHIRFHLDVPVPGTTSPGYLFRVQGWVCSTRQPVIAVEVCEGPWCRQRFTPLEARLDVASVHPHAVGAPHFGFCGEVSTLGLLGEEELSLEAILADRQRVRLASLRLHCPALPVMAPPSGLNPLLIFAFGRSGTTWLMSLLREHPSILVAGGHPFEVVPLIHSLNLLQFLSQPTNSAARVFHGIYTPAIDPRRQDSLTGTGLDLWLRREQVELHARSLLTSIESFYRQCAHDQGRPNAHYYAEKGGIGSALLLANQLYPCCRLVFLVRDFRDVLCSIRAFNNRRGYLAFGREIVDSDPAYIKWKVPLLRWQYDQWQRYGHTAMLVRYEDLVMAPEATLGRLLEYAQLESDPTLVAGMIERARRQMEKVPSHRTAQSPEQSIGRWRKELPPAECRLIEEQIGDLLQAYGYLQGRDRKAG